MSHTESGLHALGGDFFEWAPGEPLSTIGAVDNSGGKRYFALQSNRPQPIFPSVSFKRCLPLRESLPMEIRQALVQVSEIRAHLARTETFRGYRSATVAFTGAVGIAAAFVQAIWLPQPIEHWDSYLALWIGAAVLNVTFVGIEIWSRAHTGFDFTRRTTLFAVGQFLPALLVGGLLTLVIARQAPDAMWMLPGLWALVFSLGVFASCRLLPRAVAIVGAWYIVGGVLALAWGQGPAALSPWIMGLTFGGGQLLTAFILYFTLERLQDEGEE
jgi:hypothetical protein